MTFACSGCGRQFHNAHGLTRHRNSCKKALQRISRIVQKDQEQSEAERAAKIARRFGGDIGEELGGLEVDNIPLASEDYTDAHIADPPAFAPQATRSGRVRRFPKQYNDYLPSSTTHMPHMPPPIPRVSSRMAREIGPQVPDPPPQVRDPLSDPPFYETEPNEYGLFRRYPTMPTHEPDQDVSLDDLCGLAVRDRTTQNWWSGLSKSFSTITKNLYAPYHNSTVFNLMLWYYNGSNTKSAADLDALIKNVIHADGFNAEHLANFSAARENRRLDEYTDAGFSEKDGWKETSVFIPLPGENREHTSNEDSAPKFEVKNVFY